MIESLDEALAGMQYPREFIKQATGTMAAGRPQSTWFLLGLPGAGALCTAGIDGEILTAPVNGQIPFDNPGAGLASYLGRLVGQATISGQLLLVDRIWQNSLIDIDSTDEQFIDGAQIPERDANGANLGDGVIAGVEVSVATTGTGTPNITLKYTNEDGTADKTADRVIATVAASPKGAFYPIGLASGDKGIRKVQSIKLTAGWSTGSIQLVLYRVIARLELSSYNVPNAIDALTGGFPRIYDDSVLMLLFIPNTSSSSYITGHCIISQG